MADGYVTRRTGQPSVRRRPGFPADRRPTGNRFSRSPHTAPGGASSATPAGRRLPHRTGAVRLAEGPGGIPRLPLFTSLAIFGGAALVSCFGMASIALDAEGPIAAASGEQAPAADVAPEPVAEPVAIESAEEEEAVASEYGVQPKALGEVLGKATAQEVEPEPAPAVSPETPPEPARTRVEPAEPTVYVVESGDTLSSISGETGVPVDHLLDANGLVNPNFIYAGASLVIPPTSM